MTALAPSSWRLAWAERENERRRRAYRDATDAWQRRDDHLVRLRIEAASFIGCTQPRAGLPVDLDVDEVVFRVLPVATLVEAEARHIPGLPTPGSCSFAEPSSEALPPGLRAVDTGMAVVTSRRVAFAGREHRREWRYADRLGVAHHPDVPVTLLHDDSRLSGLRVPASAAVNVRFYLTLAAASAAGDRLAVVGQLDALLAAHQASPPVPLPTVGPSDAPLTAVRPDRRALAVAAVATVVFATLGPGAVGPSPAGPMRRAEAATIVRDPALRESGLPPATSALVVEPARPPAVGPQRPAPNPPVPTVPATTPAAEAARATSPTVAAAPSVSPAASVDPSPSPSVEVAQEPSIAPTPTSEAMPTPATTPTGSPPRRRRPRRPRRPTPRC
ncbi:hypothetical protein [Micromonospora sp. CA-246542]|uniref:hypothetical protein n=1 Tax=Micromonospora sp. CA-246542 TaxID=3239959 RepID=UPI003D93894B